MIKMINQKVKKTSEDKVGWLGQLTVEEIIERDLIPNGEPLLLRIPHTKIGMKYRITKKLKLKPQELPDDSVAYVCGEWRGGFQYMEHESFEFIAVQPYRYKT